MSYAYRTGASWCQRSEEYIYDPIKGPQTATTYEADVTGLNYILNQLKPYQRVSVSGADAPRYTITVYSPDPPSDMMPAQTETAIWEVLVNYKEQDIYDWAASKGVPMDDIINIQNFVRKPIPGSQPAITSGDLGLVLWYLVQYRHLKRGMEDIVFRYQYIISNSVQTTMAYANRDRLFTQDDLINRAGLVIPSGIQASLQAAWNEAPLIPPQNFDCVWTWLKRAPTSRQTQIGKVVISGEYWLQAWSTYLYSMAFKADGTPNPQRQPQLPPIPAT